MGYAICPLSITDFLAPARACCGPVRSRRDSQVECLHFVLRVSGATSPALAGGETDIDTTDGGRFELFDLILDVLSVVHDGVCSRSFNDVSSFVHSIISFSR